MKTEKEIFIGQIQKHLSNATPPRPHKKSHIRRMTKLSPLGVVLFTAAVGLSMLAGLLYQNFYVTTQGEQNLNGSAVVPLFLYDGHIIEGNNYAAPLLTTSINAGQTIRENHTLYNDDALFWTVTWDLDAVTYFYDTIDDPFYGYNVSVTLPNGDPLPEPYVFGPGEWANFSFLYALHDEFVILDDPAFPYSVNMSIDKYTGVIGTDDDFERAGETVVVNVAENDIDCSGSGLHILSVTQAIEGGSTLISINDAHTVSVYMQTVGTIHFQYTISTNSTSQVDTVSVEYTRTS